MKRLVALLLFSFATGFLTAAALPVTPYTVVARVESYETLRTPPGSPEFTLSAPYGNEGAIVAKIVKPDSLAGREIAIPFEASPERQELLVQKGTIFRFEHPRNLEDLRNRTDPVRRRMIGFPERGI